jgi:hypothetical protein
MDAPLAIGFQIDRAWIRLDDSNEFIHEPIPKTVALSPRDDTQDSQIPMHLFGVECAQ